MALQRFLFFLVLLQLFTFDLLVLEFRLEKKEDDIGRHLQSFFTSVSLPYKFITRTRICIVCINYRLQKNGNVKENGTACTAQEGWLVFKCSCISYSVVDLFISFFFLFLVGNLT